MRMKSETCHTAAVRQLLAKPFCIGGVPKKQPALRRAAGHQVPVGRQRDGIDGGNGACELAYRLTVAEIGQPNHFVTTCGENLSAVGRFHDLGHRLGMRGQRP